MKKIFNFLIIFAFFTVFELGARPIITSLDQVIVNSEGLFVNFEGCLQAVESISLTNDNSIVAIPAPNFAICPNCGYDKYTPGRFCPRCGFPDDGKVKNAKNN